MMKPADLRNRDDTPGFGILNGPRRRRVLLQPQVCPGSMIVGEEISKVPVKTAFVKDDDVVQALPANGSDDSFDISTLPWRARRGQDLVDTHGRDLMDEILSKDPIAIAQQIAGRGIPGESLSELLDSPFRYGMRGHGKVENSAPVVCQRQNTYKI